MSRRWSIRYWFLVHATACANLAAAVWLASGSAGRRIPYALNLCSALALGQLSVIAVWVAFRQRQDLWSLLLPVGGLLAVSYVRLQLHIFSDFTLRDYAVRSAIQLMGSVVILWLFRNTVVWRMLSRETVHRRFEYSVRHLLVWTTLVAMFSAFVAGSTWADGQPISLTYAIGLLAPPGVTIGVVTLSRVNVPWPVRWLGYATVGATIGAMLAAVRDWRMVDMLVVEFAAEAVVVAAWVEWGDIIPDRQFAQLPPAGLPERPS